MPTLLPLRSLMHPVTAIARVWPVLSIMTLALTAAPGANAQKQKDVPLRFTFHETAVLMNLDGTVVTGANPVPSTVVGDGNDVYSSDATIKFSSGTHDAVLNLLIGKRKLTA